MTRRDPTEAQLMSAVLVAVPVALPHVRIFRRPVINVASAAGFRVRAGARGQADCYALVRGGLHVEIELKAALGRLSDAQVAWRDFCRAWQIPHIVLRAQRREAHEVTIARWIEELRPLVARAIV